MRAENEIVEQAVDLPVLRLADALVIIVAECEKHFVVDVAEQRREEQAALGGRAVAWS